MTWSWQGVVFAPLLTTALLAAACSARLVAPYNEDLSQKASAMQAEVATWDLKMRAGAGTITDDPRNPEVSGTINRWRGEAEAMLTSAVSNDPGASGCSDTAKTMLGAIQNSIPNDLRSAATAGTAQTTRTGCEAAVVEHLQNDIQNVENALKHCQLPWVEDGFFANGAARMANAPKAPNEAIQRQRRTSCLTEFEADSDVPAGAVDARHGQAVSGLLQRLQSIVYLETRKKAAGGSN